MPSIHSSVMSDKSSKTAGTQTDELIRSLNFFLDGSPLGKIAQIQDVTPSLLLDLYEILFRIKLPYSTPRDPSPESQLRNARVLIGHIAHDVLKMDLSFIEPQKICDRDEFALRQFLKIFLGVAKLRKVQVNNAPRSQASSPSKDTSVIVRKADTSNRSTRSSQISGHTRTSSRTNLQTDKDMKAKQHESHRRISSLFASPKSDYRSREEESGMDTPSRTLFIKNNLKNPKVTTDTHVHKRTTSLLIKEERKLKTAHITEAFQMPPSEFLIHAEDDASPDGHTPAQQHDSIYEHSTTASEISSTSSGFLEENNARVASITDRIWKENNNRQQTDRRNVQGQRFRIRSLAMSTPEKGLSQSSGNLNFGIKIPQNFVQNSLLSSARTSSVWSPSNVENKARQSELPDVAAQNRLSTDTAGDETLGKIRTYKKSQSLMNDPSGGGVEVFDDSGHTEVNDPVNHPFRVLDETLGIPLVLVTTLAVTVPDVVSNASPLQTPKSSDNGYVGDGSFIDDQSSNVTTSTLSSRHVSRISYNQSPTPKNSMRSRNKLDRSYQSDMSTITKEKLLTQSLSLLDETQNRSTSAPPLLGQLKRRTALSSIQFLNNEANGDIVQANNPITETTKKDQDLALEAATASIKSLGGSSGFIPTLAVLDHAAEIDKGTGHLGSNLLPEQIPLPPSQEDLPLSSNEEDRSGNETLRQLHTNIKHIDDKISTCSCSSIATSALSVSSVAWVDTPITAQYRKRRSELSTQLAVSPQKLASESSFIHSTSHSLPLSPAMKKNDMASLHIQRPDTDPVSFTIQSKDRSRNDGTEILPEIKVGETAQGYECLPPQLTRAHTAPLKFLPPRQPQPDILASNNEALTPKSIQHKAKHVNTYLPSPNAHKWKLQFQKSVRQYKQSQLVNTNTGPDNHDQSLRSGPDMGSTSSDSSSSSDAGISELEEELKQLGEMAIKACKRQARLFELLIQRGSLS